MMYKVKERIMFKHDPICINGKPIIADCKWNFTLIQNNVMLNTEYPITLEYNEETEKDFVPLFSLNEYTPNNSSIVDIIPKNEVFVEGKDVRTRPSSSDSTQFSWIPSKYLSMADVLNNYRSYVYHSDKVKEYNNAYRRSLQKYCKVFGKSYEEIDKEVKEKCKKE